MKKRTKTIWLLSIFFIAAVLIWWNLPETVKRYKDINFAEKVISNIDTYKAYYGLPESSDWVTLEKLGIRFDYEDIEPMYYRINKNTYELVFVEGFDGPYLMWNSKERKWKVDMPTIPEDLKH